MKLSFTYIHKHMNMDISSNSNSNGRRVSLKLSKQRYKVKNSGRTWIFPNYSPNCQLADISLPKQGLKPFTGSDWIGFEGGRGGEGPTKETKEGEGSGGYGVFMGLVGYTNTGIHIRMDKGLAIWMWMWMWEGCKKADLLTGNNIISLNPEYPKFSRLLPKHARLPINYQ